MTSDVSKGLLAFLPFTDKKRVKLVKIPEIVNKSASFLMKKRGRHPRDEGLAATAMGGKHCGYVPRCRKERISCSA
ncbi:MAG: hypothetical protein J6X70_06455 [Muribaculaceae bacterium]|nr:hypothetical protein [Muribaculaceae bacterium]